MNLNFSIHSHPTVFKCDISSRVDLYTVAYETVLSRYGKEYTYEVKTKLMGRKPLVAAAILLKELDLEDKVTPEAYIAEVSQEYPKLFPGAIVLPGVEKLIAHLKKHNIPIGISTGSSNEAFDLKSTNHKSFFDQFDFILKCGSDPEVKNGKPAADAFDVARHRFHPVPKGANNASKPLFIR